MTITATTTIKNQASKEIINKFFFEQSNPYLGIAYRNGFFRSVFVLLRSLYRPDKKLHDPSNGIKSHRTIAFVFFPNEYFAARENKKKLKIKKIEFLDLHNLKFITKYLGIKKIAYLSINFFYRALKIKGFNYYNRFAYPCLAWLLYNTLIKMMSRVQKLKVVTLNMQHPLSLACAQAAVDSGHSSFFCEHATTPRAVVQSNNSYHRYYVNFVHTKNMLIGMGVKKTNIICKYKYVKYKTQKILEPVKKIGICINDLDSIKSIHDVTHVLLKNGFHLYYRVHDSDSRHDHFKHLADMQGIGFSSAKKTRINKFFQQIDIIVVGNSNVLADAIIANKKAIYYWDGNISLFDYYGIVKTYNIAYACNTNKLLTLLKKK